MRSRLAKVLLLSALIATVAMFAIGCNAKPPVDWESRYYEMEERYYSLLGDDWESRYYTMEDRYYSLLTDLDDVRSILQYASSGDSFFDIAYDLDKRGLFPPYPVRDDIDAILFCYIDGGDEVTRSQAYLAHQTYKAYTSDLVARMNQVLKILSPYLP